MGSEDLFHTRKAANRVIKKREAKPRYLIVCEGKKTEPNYLKSLLNELKITNSLIKIQSTNGKTDARSILKYAEQLAKEEREGSGDYYNKIFCVFDKDNNGNTFKETIDNITKDNNFKAITTTPCFEFWLLLHFEYTDKPYKLAKDVINDLKKKEGFSDYDKAKNNIYFLVKDKQKMAIKNAQKLRKKDETQITANPWTNVDELIDVIRNYSS